MIVTCQTRQILNFRRTRREWKAEGFEDLGERGGNLWQIYRGGRQGQQITEARIDPNGMSVWVKIEPLR